MTAHRAPFRAFLHRQQRSVASIAATVLIANTLVVASRAIGPIDEASFIGGSSSNGVYDPSLLDPSLLDPATGLPRPGVTLPPGYRIDPAIDPSLSPGPDSGSGDTLPNVGVQGVTDTTIEVVYYWKGERTQSSPFLKGTAADGANLDEELAFRAYIDYLNKYADSGGKIMGLPFNLHGRKLVPIVIAPKDGASGEGAYSPLATKIAKEIKPFAAIASHGGISTYFCPMLAEHGIFNLQTYDLGGLGGNLVQRTNGYCTPAGLSWERQIEMTIGYLKQHMKTPYLVGQPRVYGVIYSRYPGLRDVGEDMVQRLKDAGIAIAHSARIHESPTNAQAQAQTVLLQMRNRGVNTLIMPEAGAPLTITQAAQAQEYFPDYYVWPCSGTDVTAMARLYIPTQWERAEGLTCYDREFNPDAVNNNYSRNSDWWNAYREMRPGTNPPAPAPMVWSGLFQLAAGLTYAGRNLNEETFQAALDRIPQYRYSTRQGRTSDPWSMLITMASRDRSMIGDVAKLRWSSTTNEGGAQGDYRYPESRRYRTKTDFN